MEEKPLIFICYAKEDEESARRFYKDLRNAGAEPWLDKKCLDPGQKWKKAIKEAIRKSRYFIAILSSKSFTKKGFVQTELKEALDILEEFPDSSIFIIPARIDECTPSDERLKDLQWVDMFPSWSDGIEKVLRAIGISKAEEGEKDSYENLCRKGKKYYELGQFEKSIERYKKAANIVREMKWGYSEPFVWLGASYFHIGNYFEAFKYLEDALNLAKTFRQEKERAFCLIYLGCVHRDGSGDFEQAMNLYNEALKISRKINDREIEGFCLLNIGNVYNYLLDQFDQAREHYQQTLKIAKEIGDKRLEGRCHNNMGNTYKSEKQFEQASEEYKRGIEISSDANDYHNKAICHYNLGELTETVENKITHFQKAIKLMKYCKNWQSQMDYLNILVNTYIYTDQIERAIRYLNENLEKSETPKDQEIWLAFLGYTYHQSKQLQQAREYYRKAMEIATKIEDRNMQLQLSTPLGELELSEAGELYKSGELPKALERCNQAIIHLESKRFIEMMQIQKQVYNAFHSLRLPVLQKEINNYEQAIQSDPQNSNLHFKLGDCLAIKGDLKNATVEYQKARELDPSNTLILLCDMEVRTWQGLYDETISIYRDWHESIVAKEHHVIAKWILCTALALKGEDYEEHLEPLLDVEIDLSKAGYSFEEILPYFAKWLDENILIDRVIQAWQLYTLCVGHVGGFDLKEKISRIVPEELKEILNQQIGEVKIADSTVKVWVELRGRIYRRFNKVNMAIKDYMLGIIFNPDDDWLYMSLGACYAQKEKFKKAIINYDKAIKINSSNMDACLGKMEALICLRKYNEAISVFKKLDLSSIKDSERIIATFLLCIALALKGKSYEDKINPLLSIEIKIDWLTIEIDRFLEELEKERFNSKRLINAKEIWSLLKEHFIINQEKSKIEMNQ